MPRILVHRELVVRIAKLGLQAELKGFISACLRDEHPPRVYKASGVAPLFLPYQELELHHHHLHRDGDPLLVTQHIDGEIYAVALATHQTFFHDDKMQWLQDHASVLDWSACPALERKVMAYRSYDDV